MAKYEKQKKPIRPIIGDDDDQDAAPVHDTISDMVAGKPSEHAARLDAFRKADRVQMSFTAVPDIIRDMYKARAKELGLDLKAYLYHLMRLDGHNLPSQKELDGRYR